MSNQSNTVITEDEAPIRWSISHLRKRSTNPHANLKGPSHSFLFCVAVLIEPVLKMLKENSSLSWTFMNKTSFHKLVLRVEYLGLALTSKSFSNVPDLTKVIQIL